MRSSPPTTYDRTYYVPARLSVPDNYRSTPATRQSTPTSTRPSKSTKASPLITASHPRESRESRPRSRSRATSTSSNSSTGSFGPRTSRPCFVRHRSKDGKRNHSPIYIRPGISRLTPSSDTKQSVSKPPSTSSNILPKSHSHSRNNSSSSTSSHSSSIFSASDNHSRNSSISSQDSSRGQQQQRQYPALNTPMKGSTVKVAFREPDYQAPVLRTIVPSKEGKFGSGRGSGSRDGSGRRYHRRE